MHRLLVRLLPLLLLLAVSGARADEPAFRDWREFVGDLRGWSLDSSRVADVTSLMLERDAGTLVLEQGTLAEAAPLGGRVCAAVFQGRGTFQFTPRSEIERQQLRRFYGVTALRRRFTGLTLIYADSTGSELRSALRFGSGHPGPLFDVWRGAQNYLTWRKLQYVRPTELARTLIEGESNGLFWAQVDCEDGQHLFFMLDPSARERVALLKTVERESYGLLKLYQNEVVCQFFAQGDPDTARENDRPPFEAVHFRVDATFRSELRTSATAEVEVLGHDQPRRWLTFWMNPDLVVDSVSTAGSALGFFQERDNPAIWVRCEPPIAPGERRTIRFAYHGKALEREGDWVYVNGTTDWFPSPDAHRDATWDLSFHLPRELQLVASGERVEDRVAGAVRHSRWLTRRPSVWASFDVNFLRAIQVESDTLPALTVWMRHLDRPGSIRRMTLPELASAKDDDGRVANDLARCAAFYQNLFGPPVQPSIQALQTPLGVYEGYPGMVHMMLPEDKTVPGPEWTPDVVRAHEMAHQWWGLGVQPATYHDRWLSEGFADFCSIWYLQSVRLDPKSYFAILEDWRKELLENRKFLLGAGQQAGPIWLGPRTNSSSTPNDYNLVIYAKGAWVLHMLRNYLLDPQTADESRFRGLLRSFYQDFSARRPFTEDFRREVERATGEDMGWFFDQWVYGTDVPTYTFRWSAVPVEGGRWRVHGHVEQRNVPASFRMPVFVRLDFGRDRFARQRVWVSGPATDFDLPLVAEKPTRVVFNDLESVLAEVVTETR